MFKKFKPFEAAANLQFKDPDNGFLYTARTYKELYTHIITYRIQNGLEPLEELKTVVENYLCELPENCNKCIGYELQRSLSQTIRGGVQLLKNIFFKKFASQEVADKRAEQCVACKFNVFPDKNAFIHWADNIAIMQVGERKSKFNDQLASCAVCSCNLRSKVFFDGKLPPFSEEETEKMESVNCWQIALQK